MKIQSWSGYRNLTCKLPKKSLPNCYRGIPFSFEILLIMFFSCYGGNKTEYRSRVLIMSRLEVVHLPELRFANFGHLNDGFQSCLVQSNPQESVKLQSIKNRINSMIFSSYAQDSGNVTSSRLVDITFQVFTELRSLDFIGQPAAFSQLTSSKLTHLAQ